MKTWQVVVLAVLVYVSISSVAHRFRHPEMTETQLFMSLPDAIFWR